MASENRIILIGKLGHAPKKFDLRGGRIGCNFDMATPITWRDENNQKQTITEWHRVTVFDQLAQIALDLFPTGAEVYVTGQLRYRKWTDKQGVERVEAYVKADTAQLTGNKSGNNRPANHPGNHHEDPAQDSAPGDWPH